MKYLVLAAIDVDKSRYYPGEVVELMKYVGDQLVVKEVLLPLYEEPEPKKVSEPEPEKESKSGKRAVFDKQTEVTDGSINS